MQTTIGLLLAAALTSAAYGCGSSDGGDADAGSSGAASGASSDSGSGTAFGSTGSQSASGGRASGATAAGSGTSVGAAGIGAGGTGSGTSAGGAGTSVGGSGTSGGTGDRSGSASGNAGGGSSGSSAGGSGAGGTGGSGGSGSSGSSGESPDASVDASDEGGTSGASGTSLAPDASGSSCGVVPVDPNATQQAKNLLCYLVSQYGKHVLSGQQETSWASDPEVDNKWIYSSTGKNPAVRGQDFLYAPTTNGGGAESNNGAAAPTTTTSRAMTWWNAGGIPMICYHMGAPPSADSYPHAETAAAAGINSVLTPGSASYTSFIYKLDYAAAELKYLQDHNVAVLWRPFHEAAGTWFWWSKEGGSQYVRLWKFMFNYFTVTKGLHNLVWMHPFDGSPTSAFYPGKAYVDIGGADTYATNPPFTSLFSATRSVDGNTIPLALHETGAMPLPSTMFPSAAPWVLFSTWATYESNTAYNTPQSAKAAYTDSHTVNRDGVPNLK